MKQEVTLLRITFWQFQAAALVLLSLSLLKGIRLPTRFALTHYVFSYREGFIRRGLWGSLLAPLEPYSYWELTACALSVLALFLLVLWRLLRQDGAAGLPSARPWLAFLASPGLVFFFHIVGYLDYLLLILVWATLLLAGRLGPTKVRVACYLLAPIVLVLHEAGIAWVLPCLFLILITQERDARRGLLNGAVFAMLSIAVLAFVMKFGTLDEARLDEVTESLNARASFELRADAIEVLFHRVGERLTTLWGMNRRGARLKQMILSLLLFMPTTLFFTWLALRQWGFHKSRDRQVIVVVSIIGVGLAPLSLHLVGHDIHRWHALSNLTAFTAWLTMTRCGGRSVERGAPARSSLVLLLLVLNLSSTNYFFANQRPHFFPDYGQHLRAIKSWGDDTAIP